MDKAKWEGGQSTPLNIAPQASLAMRAGAGRQGEPYLPVQRAAARVGHAHVVTDNGTTTVTAAST